jgi:pimeloyl-ACP methyl ester carboxylesterase
VTALRALGASEVQDVYIRPPQGALADQPVQVMVALHGMGGNGHDFAEALAAQADRYGWLIVAPTIRYGDWTDPDQIAREDPALSAWLADYVRHLSANTGYVVNKQVLLFGHSRGAQLSLRFAEMHPNLTLGVAAASAGTYTLPVTRDENTGRALEFPFGVANLARDDGGVAFDPHSFAEVPIWIGVGGDDTNPNDVPDQWDPYIGNDRRGRAEKFSQVLIGMGADVTLNVFQGADHGLTDAMRAAGCAALARSAADATAEG